MSGFHGTLDDDVDAMMTSTGEHGKPDMSAPVEAKAAPVGTRHGARGGGSPWNGGPARAYRFAAPDGSAPDAGAASPRCGTRTGRPARPVTGDPHAGGGDGSGHRAEWPGGSARSVRTAV